MDPAPEHAANFDNAWRIHVKPLLGDVRIDKIDRVAPYNLLEASKAKGLARRSLQHEDRRPGDLRSARREVG